MRQVQRSLFDEPPKPSRDICARKHQGAAGSEAAFNRIRPHLSESHASILNWLRQVGPGTAKEYADYADRQLNTISGRFSELKRDGLILPTGEYRDGACIYRLA